MKTFGLAKYFERILNYWKLIKFINWYIRHLHIFDSRIAQNSRDQKLKSQNWTYYSKKGKGFVKYTLIFRNFFPDMNWQGEKSAWESAFKDTKKNNTSTESSEISETSEKDFDEQRCRDCKNSSFHFPKICFTFVSY